MDTLAVATEQPTDDTSFAYTHYEIEKVMLPRLRRDMAAAATDYEVDNL